MFKIKINIIRYSFFLFIFFSCSDEAPENLGEKNTNFASRQIINADLLMNDSIYIKVRLKSPLIEEYEYAEIPYTVFPKGIHVEFNEKGKKEPGYLIAKYAKVIDSEGWYEAKNNVVIINSDKDTLKTNHLFWDKKQRKIFSDDTVKIYRADGITTNISSNGIEATEDFKNFKLKNNRGTLPYKNDLKEDKF